jgi:hypothetical protein
VIWEFSPRFYRFFEREGKGEYKITTKNPRPVFRAGIFCNWLFWGDGFFEESGIFELGLVSRCLWLLGSGLVEDLTQQVVGIAAEVGAGGDHVDGGFGEFGVESGEGVAQVDLVVVVPERPQYPFDFGRLAGAVADCVDEDGDGGFEVSAGLGRELAAEGYGGEEFGDGVGLAARW